MAFRNRMQITIGPAVLSRRQCVLGRTKTFLWPVQSGGFPRSQAQHNLISPFPKGKPIVQVAYDKLPALGSVIILKFRLENWRTQHLTPHRYGLVALGIWGAYGRIFVSVQAS